MLKKVLGLVPARGGSKGIPRKNARKLGSKYLLQFTAEAARSSGCLAKTILSTEDREIAEIGKRCGLEVPFSRPMELAGDDTPMIAVVLHAMRYLLAANESYEAVCLLQPTTPFRSPATIRKCIECLWANDVDSVVSIAEVPTEFNPHWVYFHENGLLRISTGEIEPISGRELLPKAYHRDGAVFVVKAQVLLGQSSLYGRRTMGVISPPEEVFDLDTIDQWTRLEDLVKLSSTK